MDCPTNLIDDQPAVQDRLSQEGTGPHKRVADSIAQLIRSHETGATLGLEGGWGAGKTTVVNLLQAALVNEENVAVFVFDAWAHQGDPLRRTFLESLIQFLGTRSWIKPIEAENRIDLLANKRKWSKTTTTSSTTTFAKIFGASILLVPIGTPFLAASLREDLSLHGDAVSTNFWVGLTLALGWALVLFVRWLQVSFWRFNRAKRNLRSWFFGSNAQPGDWAFLSGSFETNSIQDTSELPDRTSIEFGKEFSDLLDLSFARHPDRKLVLVLDNLDRIDGEEARAIWSTLQTFVPAGNESSKWKKSTFVLVPYDPDGLRRTLETALGPGNSHGSDGKSVSDDKSKGRREGTVSTSFMDKSFQVRFYVPPPVLSNWKEYLVALVKAALPRHKEQADEIYHIYRRYVLTSERVPTPRELKLFVNQIGVVHRQWGDTFDIRHVAYFVTLQRAGTDVAEGLIVGVLPDKNVSSMLGPDLRANLAGLAFNVESAIGQQLLLSDPIERALYGLDLNNIRKYEQEHGPGFWVVLEDVALHRLGDATPRDLARTARCLRESSLLPRPEQQSILRVVRRRLAEVAKSTKSAWIPIDKEFGDEIGILCQVIEDNDAGKQIVSSVRRSIAGTPTDPSGKRAIDRTTIEGVGALCMSLNKEHKIDLVLEPFNLPGSGADWVQDAVVIGELPEDVWSFYRPNVNKDVVASALIATIEAGQATSATVSAIRVTARILADFAWGTVIESLVHRMSQDTENEESFAMLQVLEFFRASGNAQAGDAIKTVSDEGHVLHLLFAAEGEHEALHLECVLITLEQNPSLKQPVPAVGQSDQGLLAMRKLFAEGDPKLAEAVTREFRTRGKLVALTNLLSSRGSKDLFIAECAEAALAAEDRELVFTPLLVLASWRKMIDNDILTKALTDSRVGASVTTEAMNRTFDIGEAELYRRIITATLSRTFEEWCAHGLAEIGASEWDNELETFGECARLLFLLLDRGAPVILGHHFQDGLVDYSRRLCDGKVLPNSELKKHADSLTQPLSHDARDVLETRLADVAMNADGKCLPAFFEFFGHDLERAIDQQLPFVRRLFLPLIRENNESGIAWMSGVLTRKPDLLDEDPDEAALDDIRERLRAILKAPSDGSATRQHLEAIGATLGIDWSAPNQESEKPN
jgi:hypothetical protein